MDESERSPHTPRSRRRRIEEASQTNQRLFNSISSWPNQRLFNSASLRPNRRCCHEQFKKVTTNESERSPQLNRRGCNDRIKDSPTSASSWLNRRGHHGQTEDSFTQHRHGRIEGIFVAKSKTLWLAFDMVKSERSLWPNQNLFDSPSPWPNRIGHWGQVRDPLTSTSSRLNQRDHRGRFKDFPASASLWLNYLGHR